MSRLEPEIKERLEHFLGQGYISKGLYKILKAYFMHRDYTVAAIKANVSRGTFVAQMSALYKRNVLIRIQKGEYDLTHDEDSIILPPQKVEEPPEPPLQMSDTEREWMIKNYKGYRKNRSAAAQILKRSKFDICRMAIELKLDTRN
ncbi:hypothetical protein E6C60_3054 [Paenibacillus algicola]|uniref:Uncharacterized protein n=1 Tax=Paenibacillus algicola TaxID=2565926 RepID=A0A4P8XNB6_9BACL|nr:hypothetical protein [Paenibacillus algicola]QCT03765.1 hypothetical protein E6C60_3054 [Paenibacillus algicola]